MEIVSWVAIQYKECKMYVSEESQKEQYELFQEWLNQCPIKITNYEDNTTEFAIDFSMEVD